MMQGLLSLQRLSLEKIFLLLFLSLFFVLPTKASAAARFYVSPASGNYKAGDKITATVLIDTGGQAVNAAEGSLSFPTDLLEYQAISTGGSLFTFWTTNPTAGNGSIQFGGGLSNPGYNGSNGKVLSVTFKAKTTGTAVIAIKSGKILANDGVGTNIYGGANSASYSIGAAPTPKPKAIGAPLVKSSSHPDPNHWYTARNVQLSWPTAGSTGYVIAFDQNPTTDPTTATSETSKTYESVADGVWYFHAKGKIATGYTDTSHFRIQIDTVAPDEFITTVNQENGTSNPAPHVTFSANDKTSGIEKYTGSINNGTEFPIASGDRLPKQSPGDITLVIKAYDKAGNVRESKTTYKIDGIDPPLIVRWTHQVGLLDPVEFIGQSHPNDLIIVYLDDKEVDRFLSKDKQVPYNELSDKTKKVMASSDDTIAWKYTNHQLILPGDHAFRFRRTDAQSAESNLTIAYMVKVIGSTVKIGHWTINTRYVIGLLLLIILLLLVLLGFLLKKVHRLAKRYLPNLGSLTKRREIEKKLDQEVDAAMPDHEMNAKSIKEAKTEIKKKIHETIIDESQQTDDQKSNS